jgi:hypothetical protein
MINLQDLTRISADRGTKPRNGATSPACLGERAREDGVASIPLVDLSEAQAAVFNLSRCASLPDPQSPTSEVIHHEFMARRSLK